MLSVKSFARAASSLCSRCLGAIAFLVSLVSCSFNSTQLNFVRGVLKDLNAEEETVYYWMLTLPDVFLRAVPIIEGNRLFFSDGEKYLVSIGLESITEIKALESGATQRFSSERVDDESMFREVPLPSASGQARRIYGLDEDVTTFEGTLIVHSQTRWPDTTYFCSNWTYRLGEQSSLRLCEDEQGRILKFTHNLDNLGVVKRFNVMLDDQLLIDLERTGEIINY